MQSILRGRAASVAIEVSMRFMKLRGRLTLMGLLLAATYAAIPVQDTKTVWDGVFTDAQAADGRTQYETTCSRCHASDLSGNVGTSLKGDVFIRDWAGKTVAGFYDRMKTTMPRGAPGSLSDTAYLNIVAYVLQANGFPAKDAELKPDQLQTIKIESKEGPGFIPNGALVDAVGCLTQGPDKAWMLTNATDVLRVPEAGQPTPEILTAAAQKELGKNEFRLLYIFPSPDAIKGQKVYSKGLLIRDPKGNSINVTAVLSVSTTCK